jgi:uncharacterized protein YndB with AHSA1/START domain
MMRVIRVVGWTVGGLVALAVLALAVGFLLPVRHTATASRLVAGSPDEVWEAITSVQDFASWRTDIERAVSLEPIEGWPAWREEGPSGTLTYAMTAVEPGHRLGTRIVDEGLPFGGEWTYVLEPSTGGTMVTITEAGFVTNPVYRLVSRFFIGLESTMTTYLDALEARMAA